MSRYFKESELRCRCGRKACDAPKPSNALFLMLDAVRAVAGMALVVTSGCRCKWWNARKGGVTGSEHETGEGADIACLSSTARYKILAAAFACGVKRIGIGETFVHLGVSTKHDQQVVWHYYPKRKKAA